ncbi:MAG: hypothetical protein ABIT38_15825, partial [Gemmatimonadaceae bacterium]
MKLPPFALRAPRVFYAAVTAAFLLASQSPDAHAQTQPQLPPLSESLSLVSPSASIAGIPTASAGSSQAEIDLALTKTHSGSFVGTKLGTYTLGVSNVGTLATTGAITITDNLPAGLTFATGSGAGWSCGAAGQVVTCVNPGPLAPAQSSSVSLSVVIAMSAIPGVVNVASVSTPNENSALLGNNSASDPTLVVAPDPFIDLRLVKSHVGNFVVGGNATYTLNVSNIGARTTTGAITLTDNLPAGLTFVSASGAGWSCGAVGQLVTCTSPGPLTTGSASSISLVATVGSAAVPSVVNSANVSTPNEPPALLNNNDSSDPTGIDRPPPDVAIVKTAVGIFTVGQNASYSLVVTNVSTTATTGATTISDVLPAGLTFLTASGAGWNCVALGATVTCTNPATIAPGASTAVTLTVAVGAAAAPTVSNTA